MSSVVSRVSALILLCAGVTLLFASDVVLPLFVPGLPPAALWLGQLLAGAWLGVAALNWLQRSAVLGGIYGRPVVLTNLILYFMTYASLVRPVLSGRAPAPWWGIEIVSAVMTVVYAALLFRGPFDALTTSVS